MGKTLRRSTTSALTPSVASRSAALQAYLRHAGDADQGHVGALSHRPRLADGQLVGLLRHVALHVVEQLVLEEDHRVVGVHRRYQQALGRVRVRRHHALEPRDVRHQRVQNLRVLRRRADARADAREHGEGELHVAAVHVAHLGRVVEQLVKADAHEVPCT